MIKVCFCFHFSWVDLIFFCCVDASLLTTLRVKWNQKIQYSWKEFYCHNWINELQKQLPQTTISFSMLNIIEFPILQALLQIAYI